MENTKGYYNYIFSTRLLELFNFFTHLFIYFIIHSFIWSISAPWESPDPSLKSPVLTLITR